MSDKCEEGTRYIHWEQFKSALVLNAFQQPLPDVIDVNHVNLVLVARLCIH